MMKTEVELTPQAASLLLGMRKDHPNLILLLDDTSCCSNSSVMARENKPSWPVDLLFEQDELKVYVNPVLTRSLKADRIIIDAIDFVDDSLSLETDYGKRLIMSIVK